MENLDRQEPLAMDALLASIQKMVRACIQCGTCTGSCPNTFAMDYTPRRMWRMVLRNEVDELLGSRTFSMCSFCYTCVLRCPRGLPLADAVAALKQLAVKRRAAVFRHSALFHQSFLESVRRHGRVREMEFMILYLAALKDPRRALGMAPLALKLMRKGKAPVQIPSRGKGRLSSLFRSALEMEDSP